MACAGCQRRKRWLIARKKRIVSAARRQVRAMIRSLSDGSK